MSVVNKVAYLAVSAGFAVTTAVVAAEPATAAAPAKATKTWWAYEPVKSVETPAVKQAKWVRTPVDAFVLAQLEEKHFKPSPDADRATFIRRATLDTLGLIPTPQEVDGEDRNWDGHNNIEGNHRAHTRAVDKPTAGLLADLKSRGLLDSTLVVWTSEFGRTPYAQSGDGRDHNSWGYTQWLAGAGVKAGTTVGATDDIGLKVVSDVRVDTYDLHATVLQLMGLDHLKVAYLHNGRAERPTVVYGEVVKSLIA